MFDLLKKHARVPARDLLMECPKSSLKEPLEKRVRPHLK
jgi:hypothetical protein